MDSFLSWQAKIMSEYKREEQFITHNFDFEWKGSENRAGSGWNVFIRK